MEKQVKKYIKVYRNALKENALPDIDERTKMFEQRLTEMYRSQAFAEHNIYPTMSMAKIYAVVAMCLELKKENLSDKEMINIINSGFQKTRRFFKFLTGIMDRFPNTYKVVKKWNISDHENRVKDGSITYDYFEATDKKIEYRISKCKYIEIFDFYGIRSLCKIFCLTDEAAYAGLPKHIQFVRHSDLSSGECCHDEVINKKF